MSSAIIEGTRQASACVEQAEQAGQALHYIGQSVLLVNDRGLQIAEAAREQSQVANEVSESMVRINHLAEESSDSAQQTQAVNQSLVKRAENLEQLVEKFKL